MVTIVVSNPPALFLEIARIPIELRIFVLAPGLHEFLVVALLIISSLQATRALP
jgi:hypothetical protein